jgi:hypothetical protein
MIWPLASARGVLTLKEFEEMASNRTHPVKALHPVLAPRVPAEPRCLLCDRSAQPASALCELCQDDRRNPATDRVERTVAAHPLEEAVLPVCCICWDIHTGRTCALNICERCYLNAALEATGAHNLNRHD